MQLCRFDFCKKGKTFGKTFDSVDSLIEYYKQNTRSKTFDSFDSLIEYYKQNICCPDFVNMGGDSLLKLLENEQKIILEIWDTYKDLR